MYTICKKVFANEPYSAVRRSEDDACIPFDPVNTDYARFKQEINADQAQLQDADGNVMSAADAKAFVATLP
jgi:hypothetical protein